MVIPPILTGIRSSDVDMLMNLDVFGMFPSVESAIPPHFVSFAWRYLGCTRCVALSDGRVHRQSLELVTRYLQPGIRRGANRVLPSSWETSVIRLPCSNPTPAGLLASDHCDTAAWPLVCKKQRLPRKVFRSSIAWLSDWLFTLRGVSYLSTTQNSLPVAGQALLNGIPTRKVPMKGFKFVDYISFPLPKLAWRNCIDRGDLDATFRRVGHLHYAPNRRWLTPPGFIDRAISLLLVECSSRA